VDERNTNLASGWTQRCPLGALALALVGVHCSGSTEPVRSTHAPVVTVTPNEPSPSQAPPESASAAGVPTLPSLPREHWPCAVTIRGSLHQVIEYGDLSACFFPPDRWQPGCPRRRGDTAYEYDDQGRLTAYFEQGVKMAGGFVYRGRQVLSADGCIQYQTDGDDVRLAYGAECEPIHGTSQERRVELDDAGRPRRIIDRSGGARSAATDFTYAGPRLVERMLHLYVGLGTEPDLSLPWRYDYDCDPPRE